MFVIYFIEFHLVILLTTDSDRMKVGSRDKSGGKVARHKYSLT